MNVKRLIIAAGGTGGHVFPGLSIAHYLMKDGWEVQWLGANDRIESILVPQNKIKINFIEISGLKGKTFKAKVVSIFRILKAYLQVRNIMKKWKPDVMLCMGGYVSGPCGLAAYSFGIPLIIHEQNSVAGFTNKFLSKIATKVLQGFPGAFSNTNIVGNPIRNNILSLSSPEMRLSARNGPLHILVIGGSQGANILNNIMPQVAYKLRKKITVWHQTGKKELKDVEKSYKTLLENTLYKVTSFIDDIAIAYEWADLLISRSGALTVSEIAVVGLAAIFIPFYHKDRQQYLNALQLEKIGAAKIFQSKEFTAETVAVTISNWNRETLLTMAKKARKIAIPNATDRIAMEIKKIAQDNICS